MITQFTGTQDKGMPLLQVLLPLPLGFTLAFFPFLPLLVATLLLLSVAPEEPEDKNGGG